MIKKNNLNILNQHFLFAGFKLILFLPYLPLVLIIYLLRPWLIIRIGALYTSRIGHFAANTELYLCERESNINKPKNKSFDFFYINDKICNYYLLKMWKRELNILSKFILYPIRFLTHLLPKGSIHRIYKPSQNDRDIFHLFDKQACHLNFTKEEEEIGKSLLLNFGIKQENEFVCLTVRDSSYLSNTEIFYHKYRDCDIDNYLLAAEEITKNGIYVIRMGAKVNKAFKTNNPMIIDYATNGMRSEFMDIYLGAKCKFCISTSTGWDAIPYIFRKPIIFAPFTPIGYFYTFSSKYLGISKYYYDTKLKRNLTFNEIFSRNLAYKLSTEDYENSNVKLFENSSEEIRDLIVEYLQKIKGTWNSLPDDQEIQYMFMKNFNSLAIDEYNKLPLHGLIHSQFGTYFLRKNKHLLDIN